MNKEQLSVRSRFEHGLKESLEARNKMRVVFVKADGTERVMVCCISPDVVGESYDYKGSEPKPAEDFQPVWDIEANEWRSFKPSTVTQHEIVLDLDDVL